MNVWSSIRRGKESRSSARATSGLRLLLVAASLVTFAAAQAPYVNLTGTVQGPNGLPLANSTLSFTPTQQFFVAGVGTVVATTAQCATSIDGSTVGVLNPLSRPITSPVFSGTLGSGTYYIKIVWADAAGHFSLSSPEQVQQLLSTGSIQVSAPPSSAPANATAMRVYMSTTSGTETFQGSVSPSATYTRSTPLVSGAALPSTNNTVCQIVANDAGWPSGTGYVVDFTTPSGAEIAGYPMQWQLLGPGNTVNLSQGLPLYNGTVQFPSPILATPFGHATQSISGGLSLGVYPFFAGSVNGVVYTSAYTSFATAVAACSSTLWINSSIPLSVNTVVPSTCALLAGSGGLVTVANGVTLTINGPVIAPPVALFAGSGTVTGLRTVLPEWFGANAISAAVEAAFNQTLGGVLQLQPGAAYTSAFTAAPGWTLSNVTINGAGAAYSNSANTQLIGGTVIQGGIGFCGASGININDVGFDVGSVVSGTSTVDALAIQGTSQCAGSPNPAEPLIQDIHLNHVTCMLSSGAVQFHCVRIEHANNWSANDLTMYFGTHGFALKSINGIGTNITGYGEGNDCVIVKADAYTATAHNIFNKISCSTLSNANVLGAGLIYDAENGASLNDIHASDVVVVNATFGMKWSSNFNFGPSAMDNISLSNFKYKVDTSYTYSTTIQCLELDGLGANTYTNVHVVGMTCVNETGLTFFPMNMTIPMVGVFDSTVISGTNSNGSLIAGTSVTFNGYTELNATNSKPFTLGTSGYNIYISGYSSPVSLAASAIATGAAIIPKGGIGNGFGIANGDGIYASSLICSATTNGPGCTVVAALATPTLMVGTGGNSGLLRVRDNTSGASALFLIDPNTGATGISGTITGLAAGGITFGSGQWHFTLTAGATPRALYWTIYD